SKRSLYLKELPFLPATPRRSSKQKADWLRPGSVAPARRVPMLESGSLDTIKMDGRRSLKLLMAFNQPANVTLVGTRFCFSRRADRCFSFTKSDRAPASGGA